MPDIANKIRLSQIPANLRTEVNALLMATLTELMGRAKRNIRAQGHVTFGKLVSDANWMPRSIMDDTQIIIELSSMGGPQDYAAYVEFGTKPHWPPLKVLYRWVEEKFKDVAINIRFQQGRAVPTGRVARWNSNPSFGRSRAIYQIARAVQRKIGMRGTRPARYMQLAIESMGINYAQEGAMYLLDPKSVLMKDPNLWNRIVGTP